MVRIPIGLDPPLNNIRSPGVIIKCFGEETGCLPGVNHMHGMQYQIVLNIYSGPNSTNTVIQIYIHNSYNYSIPTSQSN